MNTHQITSLVHYTSLNSLPNTHKDEFKLQLRNKEDSYVCIKSYPNPTNGQHCWVTRIITKNEYNALTESPSIYFLDNNSKQDFVLVSQFLGVKS